MADAVEAEVAGAAEITAEMIEAGAKEYVDLDLAHADVRDVVAWVYEAMERARRDRRSRDQSPPRPKLLRNNS
jgi:hypothetical protein